jgi:hypothetical protein
MEYLEALRRLRATALKAVRRAAFGAPLLAAILGGALPARASPNAQLNINVTIQGIGSIIDLTAVSGASSGTIALSWTEPYHSAGVAPYSYDVRASTVAQIVSDVAFSTNSLLSAFSPSVIPSPGTGGGAAGFIVSGLTPNVTYYFAMREKDSTTFTGSWSRTLAPARNVNNFAVATASAPAPSAGALQSVWISSLTAAWSVVPGATDYFLVASTSPTNPPTSVAASSMTASSTGTLTGLGANTTYFLFVAACANGCSGYAAFASTVTLAAPAVALSSSAISTGTVTLSWGANGDPAGTLFRVQQSTDGVSYASVASSTQTSVVVGGLSGSSTYYFDVIAFNSAGTPAPASSTATVVTLPGPPSAPGVNGAPSVFVSSLTANWTISSSATDYVLVASTSPALPPSAVAASSTTLSSTATLTGLAPDTTYFFSVAACNGAGCSAFTALGSTETFAAPALSLSTTAVSSSTVSLAWNPNGNPLGSPFVVLESTDGVTYSAVSTVNAPAANLAMLTGGVTYYFQAVALSGDGSRTTPSNTVVVTLPTGPTPSTPTGLAATPGLLAISLTWNALPVAQQGVGLQVYELLRSTNAAFGYAQIAALTATSYSDKPLAAGATFFYKLVAKALDGAVSAPSAPVSAAAYTILPMEPLGVVASASSTTVTLSWSPTKRFIDGSLFLSTGTPSVNELIGYQVYRSTSICDPSYVLVSTLPISTPQLTDITGGLNYYYRLFSFNSAGVSTNVVTLSSLGQHDYFLDDCVSDLVMDDGTAAALNGSTNGQGDIRIVRTRRPQDVGNGVFESIEWQAYINGALELKNWTLPKAARIVLHFSAVGGVPTPDTSPAAGFTPLATVAAGTPPNMNDLGAYWFNGSQWVKMYGKVDSLSQTVNLASPNLGVYQVRAQARSAGAVFDLSNLSSRVITPNGDGLNDTLIFSYDPGPNNVQPVGKIFDLQGAYVADMAPGIVPNTLTWNGYMNGLPVHSGVYVYRITGDGKTFTGSIVVAR